MSKKLAENLIEVKLLEVFHLKERGGCIELFVIDMDYLYFPP